MKNLLGHNGLMISLHLTGAAITPVTPCSASKYFSGYSFRTSF